MPLLGVLELPVVPDLTGFGARAASEVNLATAPIARSATGIGNTISSRIGGALRGLGSPANLLGIGLLTVGLGSAVDAFREAAKIGARTDAVIESTGANAWISADAVEELAKSIRDYSGLDDEVIQAGENILLGFQNIQNAAGIGNDIFDQAVVTMADMAAAGRDAADAAKILGKALSDPLNASRLLKSAGVEPLTEAQKEQIKTLVANGDTVGAQRIILDQFAATYEGTARRVGEADPWSIIESQMGDLVESVGGTVASVLDAAIPVAKAVIDVLDPLLKAVAWLIGVLEPVLVPAIAALAGVIIGKALWAFALWGKEMITTTIPALWSTALAVGGQLYINLGLIATRIAGSVTPALAGMGARIFSTVIPALGALASFLPALVAIAGALAAIALYTTAKNIDAAVAANLDADLWYANEVDRILGEYRAGKISEAERDQQIRAAQAERDKRKQDVPSLGPGTPDKVFIPGSVIPAPGSLSGFARGGFLGPDEWGLVGEVGPELIRAGRAGATVAPLGGEAFGQPIHLETHYHQHSLISSANPREVREGARLLGAEIVKDAQRAGRLLAGVG